MDFTLPPCPPLDDAAGEPPQIVQEAMARHRLVEHGLSFQLGRDVHYQGHSPKRGTLDYIAPSPKTGALFTCSKPGCVGRRFIVTAPPYGDPERNAFLELWDPTLRKLAGSLHGADRAALVEAYDRGGLAKLLANGTQARAAKQVSKRTRRVDKQRIEGAQKYMLQQRMVAPIDNDAIWDLVQLHERDPALYRKVTGADKKIEFQTARRHWQNIDAGLKARARKRWADRPEAEKQRLIAERDRRT
jgi:hypothetical protein